jgi:hypothetical protein
MVQGWIVRQLLDDVRANESPSSDLLAELERTHQVGFLSAELLPAILQDELVLSVERVARGVLNGSMRSTDEARLGDPDARALYREALRLLLQATRARSSTIKNAASD